MDLRTLFLLALVATFAAAPAFSEQESASEEDPIDPRARAEVSRMADFLKALDLYELDVRLDWESTQESGLKLTFGSDQKIIVSRPDRLVVTTKRDDGRSRKTWFSGGTLTSLDVGENVYTQSEVPADLPGMLDWSEAHGVPPSPLLDFLYPNVAESFLSNVESALYVGTSFVDDVACHHVAFRTPEVDYQLWIRADGDPLPLRYAIASTALPSNPWFAVRFLRWNLDPSVDGFDGQLPEGARQIEQVPPQPAENSAADDEGEAQ